MLLKDSYQIAEGELTNDKNKKTYNCPQRKHTAVETQHVLILSYLLSWSCSFLISFIKLRCLAYCHVHSYCLPSINILSFFMKYSELNDLPQTRMCEDCSQTNQQSLLFVTICVSSLQKLYIYKKKIHIMSVTILSKQNTLRSSETGSTLICFGT